MKSLGITNVSHFMAVMQYLLDIFHSEPKSYIALTKLAKNLQIVCLT